MESKKRPNDGDPGQGLPGQGLPGQGLPKKQKVSDGFAEKLTTLIGKASAADLRLYLKETLRKIPDYEFRVNGHKVHVDFLGPSNLHHFQECARLIFTRG